MNAIEAPEVQFHMTFTLKPDQTKTWLLINKHDGGCWGGIALPAQAWGSNTFGVHYTGESGQEKLGERKTLSAALALFMRRYGKEA